MFFGKNKISVYYKNSSKKASLQACHDSKDPNFSDSRLNPKNKNQRTFSLAPSEWKASMCVEATFSFSFFFLFLVHVFSLILLFQNYTQDLSALWQKGKQIASISYITEGATGSNENLVRLQKMRTVEANFLLFSFPKGKIESRCVIKPWTGYDVTEGKSREEEDIIVYMTRYGSVYHKNRACTHLSMSVQGVFMGELGELRNKNGENYNPCEYCGDDSFVTFVYVTDYGDRYHTSIRCRGLIRYVRSIPLSQVNGVPECSKCGA